MKLHPSGRILSVALLALVTAGTALYTLKPHSSTVGTASQPSHTARLAQHIPATTTPAVTPQLHKPDAATQARLNANYGQLPLSFEVNQGQTDPQVKFLSRGEGYTLFLTASEAVLSLGKADETADTAVVRMKLLGGNAEPSVTGMAALPGSSNYLIGNDRTQWHTDVAQYAKVKYQNVYPGVDLVYYGKQRQLEYDFIVAPGTDPQAIQLGFSGVDSLRVDAAGNLLLHTAQGKLVQHKPLVYQDIAGKRVMVEGSYALAENSPARDTTQLQQVGFQIAHYDTSQPLVIDPLLSYSTYLGGSSTDSGTAIALDSSGNAYVTGQTQSSNFPVVNALQSTPGSPGNVDAFVTKLNAAGTALIYSTYLGGSSTDIALGIAVDSSGNAYVTGYTLSSNFPTLNPAQTAGNGFDAFVAKLNAAGNALVYSTYLGGNSTDFANAISIDSSGNAYVTGNTDSSNFPAVNALDSTSNGSRDSFVTKLNAAGNAYVYSTYLGGNGADDSRAIAVDVSGNAYVAGSTASSNFPVVNGLQTTRKGNGDAFVTKLNPAGSALLYSTYVGGTNNSGSESATGIAVDGSGNAHLTGFTPSFNFPLTPDALQPTLAGGTFDAFVTTLNPTGSALLYSSYLGGNSNDQANAIALDSRGNTFITGTTTSTNFPLKNPLGNFAGNDAFVTELDAVGNALVYSTYLGGNAADSATGIAVDSSGNAYITGFTISTTFPVTSGAPQLTRAGNSQDGFISKISPTGTGNGSLQFSAPLYSVVESTVTATISVTRSIGVNGAVSVTYATSNGTATSPADYVASSGTLSWADGDSAPKSFTVPITGDTLAERNETVNLTLSNPAGGATLGAPNPATLVIVSDDDAVQFNFGNVVVDEGAGSVTVTVLRLGNATNGVNVAYGTENGSAQSGTDFTASSGTLFFSGSTKTRTITVPILDDTLVEDTETFNVVLSSPFGTTLGDPATVRIVIQDNEPSQIRLSSPVYNLSEGGTQAVITVLRSGNMTAPAAVDYASSDNNARAGTDYTAVSGTLNFAANQRAATFAIPIIDDALVEPNEVVNVNLSNPQGAQLVSPTSAILIIRDNEPGQLRFSSPTYSVSEDTPTVTISVYRLGDSTGSASVGYASFDGTANGMDYSSVNGTLFFQAGQNLRTFTVPIFNDSLLEANETVNFALFSPVGATLVAPVWSTLTIVSED